MISFYNKAEHFVYTMKDIRKMIKFDLENEGEVTTYLFDNDLLKLALDDSLTDEMVKNVAIDFYGFEQLC